MKFGKHLKREGKREWEAFYVNYKSLKKSLSGAVEPFRQAVATSSSSLSTRAADQLIHQLFMTQLQAELTKVNQFYFVIEGECRRKLDSIEMQIQMSGFGLLEDLVLSIFQFVETLDHLRKYAVLNYIALVKIIKKRNKQIQDYEVLHPEEVLLVQPFYCSQELYQMIKQAEEIVGQLFLHVKNEAILEHPMGCPLCGHLFQNPVILSCGHPFCWECLCKASPDCQNCPSCHKDQIVNPEAFRIDRLLSPIMRAHFHLEEEILVPKELLSFPTRFLSFGFDSASPLFQPMPSQNQAPEKQGHLEPHPQYLLKREEDELILEKSVSVEGQTFYHPEEYAEPLFFDPFAQSSHTGNSAHDEHDYIVAGISPVDTSIITQPAAIFHAHISNHDIPPKSYSPGQPNQSHSLTKFKSTSPTERKSPRTSAVHPQEEKQMTSYPVSDGPAAFPLDQPRGTIISQLEGSQNADRSNVTTLPPSPSQARFRLEIVTQPPREVRTRTAREVRNFGFGVAINCLDGGFDYRRFALRSDLYYAPGPLTGPEPYPFDGSDRIFGGTRIIRVDKTGVSMFTGLTISEPSTRHQEREFCVLVTLLEDSAPTRALATCFTASMYAYSHKKVLVRRRARAIMVCKTMGLPEASSKDKEKEPTNHATNMQANGSALPSSDSLHNGFAYPEHRHFFPETPSESVMGQMGDDDIWFHSHPNPSDAFPGDPKHSYPAQVSRYTALYSQNGTHTPDAGGQNQS